MSPAAAWAWTWSASGWTACAGTIDVSSKPGMGTSVTLRLPLTMAIIDGLLVSVGDACFVLPLASTLECIELTRADIARANGKHLANVRGEIIPYIRLREHFNMPSEPPAIEQIMMVETEEGRFGFVVDQVLGNCQTVIKSLGRFYRHVQIVSGATILGNGSVALILDPERLVQDACSGAAQTTLRDQPERAARTEEMALPRCDQSSAALDERQRRSNSDSTDESPALPSAHGRQANGRRESADRAERSPARERRKFMGTAVVNEGRTAASAPETDMAKTVTVRWQSGRERVANESRKTTLTLVLQEIMRLVDASKEGRLSERGKADHSSTACTARWCRASTRCWTRFCCPSARATGFWRRSPAAKSTN